MNHTTLLKSSLFVAALLALPLAQATQMSKSDYKASKIRISADYTADKTACGSFSGHAKLVCVEQAKSKEKLARAELEFVFTGKTADQTKILVAMADGDYAVAKASCGDKAGNSKDVCVKEAKAVKVKALADAKLGRQIGEARTDNADTKRDADYKVATEKCDAFAGDVKSACIDGAKLRFGKT